MFRTPPHLNPQETTTHLRNQPEEVLRELWQESRREASAWRMKAEAAQILLDSLRSKADNAERKAKVLKSVLSPIRSLPTEILVRIFVFACLGDTWHLFPASEEERVLPTSHVLVQVSRLWRDIALDTGEIWGHRLVVQPVPNPQKIWRVRHFKAWDNALRMYGRRLAHVDFQGTNNPWGPKETTLPIYPLILRYQEQLISLKAPGQPLLQQVGDASGSRKANFPLLETLNLFFVPEYQEALPVTFSPIQTSLPKLRKLSLYDASPQRRDFLALGLPWQQLTELALVKPVTDTSGNPFEILEKLGNLEYLRLSMGWKVSIWFREPPQPTVLRRLKTMEIHDPRLDLCSFHRFFRHIVTPNLLSFDLLFSEYFEIRERTVERTFEDLVQFLEGARHLSQIRVVLGTKDTFDPTTPFPQNLILKLSGDARFFAGLNIPACGSEMRFTQLGRYMRPPFSTWPRNITTMDRFIDKILEREDHWFNKSDQMDYQRWVDPKALAAEGRVYYPRYTRFIMDTVCQKFLGNAMLVNGSRKAYFAVY